LRNTNDALALTDKTCSQNCVVKADDDGKKQHAKLTQKFGA